MNGVSLSAAAPRRRRFFEIRMPHAEQSGASRSFSTPHAGQGAVFCLLCSGPIPPPTLPEGCRMNPNHLDPSFVLILEAAYELSTDVRGVCRTREGHSVVPVYRQLIGDTLTPVTAFCKIQEGDWAFLFESVIGGERLGTLFFLGSGRSCAPGFRPPRSDPDEHLGIRSRRANRARSRRPAATAGGRLAAFRAPHLPGLPRFCGGSSATRPTTPCVASSNLPNPPTDDRGLPDLCFAFCDRVVIFDHITKTIAAVAHAHIPGVRGRESGVSKDELLRRRVRHHPVDGHCCLHADLADYHADDVRLSAKR